jgi:DNA ligase-1
MLFSEVANTYQRIEETSKRLQMTDILVELFMKIPSNLIDKMTYLTQGKLYPDYVGVELGIAEKMAITSIANVSGLSKNDVMEKWKSIGDLGSTAESLLESKYTFHMKPLTVEKVYTTLEKMASAMGKGSSILKINLLSDLLADATPIEAKYLVRVVTGKLRLGIGDMTILDALSIAYGGGKENRKRVERAYNLSSDIGEVAKALSHYGVKGADEFKISVGRPIRPMLCERLTSAEEILEKMSGKASVEYKYDGLRIQAHISQESIELFSRRLENITLQFPDVVKALDKSIAVKNTIVDGECVAIDPNTGAIQPFQVITHRRGRKYEIKRVTREIPVIFFLFDLLYADGVSYVDESYPKRLASLRKIVEESEQIILVEQYVVSDPEELDGLMAKSVELGCEGVVVKSIKDDSTYQAGSRGFLWVKYKRDYRSEMADPVDLVVVGGFAGRGRRAGTYGALLTAAYDKRNDVFRTISKIGTGFDDETLKKLPNMFKVIDNIHPRVDSKIEADFWFAPDKVIEIVGSELTLSPSHTCGLDVIRQDAGIAIRFPRFTGRWRTDKSPEDATTVSEVVEMYKSQLKKIH